MNYKLEGDGRTLLFIHGLSDSLLYWEYLAANLKDDFQILRVDLQGHGESELIDSKITIDTYVNDIKNLLDELDIGKAVLIGFSLGSVIALQFALKFPDIAESLVLMSCLYRPDSHLTGIFNNFIKTLNKSFEEFYDYILPMVLCPDVINANKEELELLKTAASKTANTEAYINAVEAVLDFKGENNLDKISVPTLILAGKYDDITTLEIQKEVQNSIKNSRLIVFGDVKHNLLVGENNDKILKILKKECE